ncbi:MAG TPA: exodeoxyribonuclease III [Candidatus Paceibacterota bacterium]
MKEYTIISWNVNGIRASQTKGALDVVFHEQPDLLLIQETKAHKEQLTAEILQREGYTALFHSPLHKKGYSGTAIYSKIPIVLSEVSFPAPHQALDEQGRLLTVHTKDFSLINGYFPNGGGGVPEKLQYKLDFYDAFIEWQKKFLVEHPKSLIMGDLNIAHTEIDLARPKENEKNVGFLPVERAKIDALLATGYMDCFRVLHKEQLDAYTYWDQKTFARARNVGWRIDYALASQGLFPSVIACEHLTDIMGSDHCPVKITFKA